jgi:hypothetical protein
LKKEIRMKKALRCSVPLLLALVLGTGMAIAGDLAPAVAAAPVCATSSPAPVPAVATAEAPAALALFTPEAQTAAICPLIGCANDEYCRRDRDCTTAAGGVCNLFCPTKGCCSYPAP